MTDCRSLHQFGLSCLILAALTGLLGFVILYHYANYERPTQQFAIVIDAGSTQTRSSLFTISVDVPRLVKWTNELEEDEDLEQDLPLMKLLRVKQVSTCVNGGPLAAIQSEKEASDLAMKCLRKFAQRIKRIDFAIGSGFEEEDPDGEEDDEDERAMDADEMAKELALLEHRVDSVTHLYLGATAGMRALSELNETRALQKINWIDRAINGSNSLMKNVPYINKDFVGIIKGSEEAVFGWISVNFVCNNLQAKHRVAPDLLNSSSVVYELESNQFASSKLTKPPEESFGTLELGGASAQMAHQADNVSSPHDLDLQLFNGNYQMVTRSDLCLGMSQATLRANYVLLRDLYAVSKQLANSSIVIENACMQNGSVISLSNKEISDLFAMPCLVSSEQDLKRDEFKKFIASKASFKFVGSGKVGRCDVLLTKLIEPAMCKQYFSLCPGNKVKQAPPKSMPFVTISGYNKALKVLNLHKVSVNDTNMKNEHLISEELGGFAIDHDEYLSETENFCALNVQEFPVKFPKMNKAFYAINCLQLVYINKLLTEFYLFDPKTSWKQIKFFIFPVAPKQTNKEMEGQDRYEIGWTLGLLLNATSRQFASQPKDGEPDIFYHHGASVLFVMRTTMFLMLACILIAISLLMIAIVSVKLQQRSSAYIIHP